MMLPPRIYIFAVRAVDAAGNASAYSYRTLGQFWRDEAPGAPSELRVDRPTPGLLRLSWSPSPTPSAFNSPPIAGYEVYLDGHPVGQVGRGVLTMPVPPSGPHTFGVRAFNAIDRYSPLVELDHVVD